MSWRESNGNHVVQLEPLNLKMFKTIEHALTMNGYEEISIEENNKENSIVHFFYQEKNMGLFVQDGAVTLRIKVPWEDFFNHDAVATH